MCLTNLEYQWRVESLPTSIHYPLHQHHSTTSSPELPYCSIVHQNHTQQLQHILTQLHSNIQDLHLNLKLILLKQTSHKHLLTEITIIFTNFIINILIHSLNKTIPIFHVHHSRIPNAPSSISNNFNAKVRPCPRHLPLLSGPLAN